MYDIFGEFIKKLFEYSGIKLDFVLDKLVEMVFYVAGYMGDTTGITLFTSLETLFYGFGLWVLILKFLKKGFETYVVGTEGDPDSDPLAFLFQFIKALILMLCFPFIYEMLARVTIGFGAVIIDNIGDSGSSFLAEGSVIGIIDYFTDNVVAGIISVIGLILLYFQILMRGAEMYILRLGFYLACAGIVESDNGAFAPYMMMFLKCAVTTLVQVSLLQLSITLLSSDVMMMGWAFLFLAISAPKFLQQFMVPTGGGGSIMGKVASGVRIADVVSRLGK
ncbi:conjugal transfer protein TrbL family protein [Acetobacterium wieringae]|uniref:conjugal transfer protein TrbL family protein n=1 Tax=Acetobacterium wieringae TaxID=52694 RepID=UPI002B1F775C|nr:conjugal transfer protein TrbL family protein [Acetobacterium wieringae]MEA4805031.1 DUF6102 family protein [Acetobacterium wieringae]